MAKADEEWVVACRRFEAMTVAEADKQMNIEPTLVGPHETLLEVTRKAVEQPTCSVISVVDGRGKLLGLLPARDLAFAAFIHVMPELFLRFAHDLRQAGQVALMSHGRTAGDVMRPPLAVRPRERLEDIFGRFLRTDLDGLPIVDDDNRVVGYLGLFEFFCVWINSCYIGPRTTEAPAGGAQEGWD